METPAKTGAPMGKGGVAEAIVGGTLIGVHENIISLPQLLKFFFRMRILRIFVRMELHCELAISALDLLVGDVSLDAKHFVIVAFLRGHVTN